MYKLLNAGFTRLMKNKMFWTIIIINLGIAGFVLINRYQALRYFDETLKLEELLTTNLLFIGIFLAIFISIFVGIEYSDGVIRNKIIAGHSRTSIYISNLMISILGALLIELIYMLFITIIGTFLLGAKLIIPIYTFVWVLLGIIMIFVAYSTIFNFVSLIFSNATLSIVICVLLTLVMFIENVLLAPVANATKFIDNVYLDAQGNQQIEKVENANYPGDEKKKICQILSNINPTGQTNEISNILTRYSEEENTDNIKTLLIYSVGLTFVVNGMGIYLFNRKELK